MARVRDLWHSEVPDPSDPSRTVKRKTARHPDRGGSKTAKRWLAVWIGPDGKEKTRAFRIQDAAGKYARAQEEDVDRGEYIDRKAGRELFGPLAAKWIRLRELTSGSRDRYETANRLHIEPVFGKRQVASVKPSEVLEWLRGLAAKHGHSTQDLAFTILCGAFDMAVADGLRKDNPARSPIVPRPRKELREREAWPAARVWGVVDAHPDEYRLIPVVSAGCGLRQGEAFALALEDFDFDAGTVALTRQINRVKGRFYFKRLKGGKTRTAPLSPGVGRAVQAYAEKYPPRAYSLPWLEEDGTVAAEPHTCSLLFRWHGDDPRSRGRHIRPSSYDRSVWKPALLAAGVIAEPERGARGGVVAYGQEPGDGAHALRHFYATTLMDAGVSLAGVMSFMGHSKKGAPITVGIYGHVTEATFEAARTAIDRALFPLRPVQDHRSGGTGTEQAGTA